MMELKVYNPEDSFLKRIEWNYEELKCKNKECRKIFELKI